MQRNATTSTALKQTRPISRAIQTQKSAPAVLLIKGSLIFASRQASATPKSRLTEASYIPMAVLIRLENQENARTFVPTVISLTSRAYESDFNVKTQEEMNGTAVQK